MQSLIMARTANDWRAWVLHIADDLGDEIFALPFADAFGRMQ